MLMVKLRKVVVVGPPGLKKSPQTLFLQFKV